MDKPYLPSEFAGAEAQLGALLRRSPIPDSELAENAQLFVSPRTIKRLFFFDEIYKKALAVHGIVIQFGARWGRDVAVLQSLRTIYEPFNASRSIVAFDTFEGFPTVDPKDGESGVIRKGVLSVSEGYDSFLRQVLEQRQLIDPLRHVNRVEVIKGNAGPCLRDYLEAHPETIVALAHFDMDLYEPTKECLELLRPYLTRGSVLAFDELQSAPFPGETVALREVFGIQNVALQRSALYSGYGSYFIV